MSQWDMRMVVFEARERVAKGKHWNPEEEGKLSFGVWVKRSLRRNLRHCTKAI